MSTDRNQTSSATTMPQRLVAEALGTGLLIVAVVGSGISASRLSPDDIGLQLLENAAATAGALAGLILMFSAVSGAHFNPAVTLLERLLGNSTTPQTSLYVAAQTVGACIGTAIANVMFDLPMIELSTTRRSSGALWLSEAIATAALLLLIQGCVRSGRSSVLPFAVGAWIGGAYWFTSSTSFANPAVTFARTLSDTFAGIAPASAPMFVAMQLIGVGVAFGLMRGLYPTRPAYQGNAIAPHVPTVLFVCVHNAGRSQMAAGWLRHLAGERAEVRSGGSAPGTAINPAAVAVMAEVGIDIAAEIPKLCTDDAVQQADAVITMGCGDTCPFYPGKRYEDWELDDPAGMDIDTVRRIRDEIRERVESLMAGLGIADETHAETL